MLKKTAKDILKKLGLYELIRWSSFFHLYLTVTKPMVSKLKKNEVNFLASLVERESVCFDIGANVGEVTDTFLRLNASKVIALECDKKNIRILNIRYKRNAKVEVVGKAVSDRNAVETFYQLEEGSAYNTLSSKWKESLEDETVNRFKDKFCFSDQYEVETVTLDALIERYGVPYCIKIDVEGHELNAIRGLHHRVPVIWFECNLPEFRDETIECIRHLSRLNTGAVYNYTVDQLFSDDVKFVLDRWVNCQSMTEEILNNKARFMELFCKNTECDEPRKNWYEK